ncbi:hypothetical protein VTK56DRAFT_1882 [Thermocarpiscus australiensis]
MRPHVPSLVLILGSLSHAQAAAYERRDEEGSGRAKLAEGFISMFNRLGGGRETVTQTVRQTITVGAAGAVGGGLNFTGGTVTVTVTSQADGVAGGALPATITVTAAASTVTVCPDPAQGVAEGGDSSSAIPGGAASSAAAPPPVGIASGGVGVTIIPVPTEARRTSAVGAQPAVSQLPATFSNGAVTSSLAAMPTQSEAGQPGLSQPPGLSTAPSSHSSSLPPLQTPPGLSSAPSSSLPPLQSPPVSANSSSVPVAGAPVSETSAAASTTTTIAPLPVTASETSAAASSTTFAPLPVTASETSAAASSTTFAPLPGTAVPLSSTLELGGAGGAAVPTTMPNPPGAFGGVAGLIPMASAAVPLVTPTVTPAVANGAGPGITINVSGLSLSSHLNLGNLAQQTPTARA